jgi:hypothetical protein
MTIETATIQTSFQFEETEIRRFGDRRGPGLTPS